MAMSETASTLHDTHAAVRRLTAAGMLEPHAEAVVGEQVHLLIFMAMSETASTLHDTHAAVRRLTAAGMLEPHAEAVVGEQVHLIQHNLATKVDI